MKAKVNRKCFKRKINDFDVAKLDEIEIFTKKIKLRHEMGQKKLNKCC